MTARDSPTDVFAVVTTVHAKACTVVPDNETGEIRCTYAGKLYENLEKETKPVAVGDRVRLTPDEQNPTVVEVLPRRNTLKRPSPPRKKILHVIAANVDRMLVVASVRSPALKPGLIDRFLVAAGIEKMDGVVCINKIDLVGKGKKKNQPETCRAVYTNAGYKVFLTCAVDGRGVQELKNYLARGLTLIVGHSGVGKSTLLNAMDPALRLKTGDITRKGKAGRHTTTQVSLLRLDSGGFFIDTPGIREFGVAGIEPHHLGYYFPEIASASPGCRFPNCTHDHEPDCAVREKTECGAIHSLRYESYLRILKSL